MKKASNPYPPSGAVKPPPQRTLMDVAREVRRALKAPMLPNGRGMTQDDLALLPEVRDVVLWQDDDGPTSVMDLEGTGWMIGFYQGRLCKRRMRR